MRKPIYAIAPARLRSRTVGAPFPGGLGAPCQIPNQPDGWTQPDGSCSNKAADFCRDANDKDGMIASVPDGTGDLTCALLQPQQGDTCVIPGTSGFVPIAGFLEGDSCVDVTANTEAVFTECKAEPEDPEGLGAGNLLSDLECLIIASSQKHTTQFSVPNQPPGSVVSDKSLCTSGVTFDFQLPSGLLKVCVEQAPAPAPTPGDPCFVNGQSGKLDQALVCVATPTAKAGDPCTAPSGKPGTYNSGFACVELQSPVEGSPCTDATGPGVFNAQGVCVHPSKVGDACDDNGALGTVLRRDSDNALICIANGSLPAPGPVGAACPADYPVYDDSIGRCLKVVGGAEIWNPVCSGFDSEGKRLVWTVNARRCEPLEEAPAPEAAPAPSSKLPWVIGLGLLVALGVSATSDMKAK